VAKLSESKPSWSYLALSPEDAFQKASQIDLRLYGSPTKFRPMKKHTLSVFVTVEFVLSGRMQNTFVISIG